MDEGKASVRDIRKRTFDYALRAVGLYRSLGQTKDRAGELMGKQYLRSATSIGANVEEAQSAESRPDFIHKYSIAQKEARESLYWLRLLAESGIVPKRRIGALLQETDELIAVITSILVNTKKVGKK